MSNEDFDVLDVINSMSGDDGSNSGNTVPVENSANSQPVELPKATAANVGGVLDSIFSAGGLFEQMSSGGTEDGSGDVVQDLINWVSDKNKLPSNQLYSFLSNYTLKTELAIFFLIMENLNRVKNLTEFIRVSEEVLYDAEDVPNLEHDDLEKRHADAVKCYENTVELTRKSVYSLKQAQKKGANAEIDKIKMLIEALPADKLKQLIKDLN